MSLPKPPIPIPGLALEHSRHGDRFEAAHAAVGPRLGLDRLGVRITAVPPGKTAWPCHAHLVNEELALVLEGCGSVRIGGQRFPIRAGDLIGFPADKALAHQIVNDSDAPLRYLMVSTQQAPDVLLYPESGKFFVVAGSAPGADQAARSFAHVGRIADAVGYWDGEA